MTSTTHTASTMLITAVRQSLINPAKWILALGCGHDVVIVRKTRPTRKRHFCAECARVTRDKAVKQLEANKAAGAARQTRRKEADREVC